MGIASPKGEQQPAKLPSGFWPRDDERPERLGKYDEPPWKFTPNPHWSEMSPHQDRPMFMPPPDFDEDVNWKNSNNAGIYVAISVPLLLIIGIAVCCWYLRWRHYQHKKMALAGKNLSMIGNQYLDANTLKQRSSDLWEIKPENVSIRYANKLGSGAFADVYVGDLTGDSGIKRVYTDVLLLSNFHDCEVAVKMLHIFADETSKNEFQKEINFMKSLKYHPHLICFLGYVPDVISPLLLLEYCSNGDLLHFIREHKNQLVHGNESQENLKVKNLVSFAWQIANGLEYFTSLGFIHRDVALRNVLLDKNNVCKIGDFGLCRMVDNQIYTNRGGRLPVRWMSIESLKSFEYSVKTDVWSYGVLLYELFSFGGIPYAGLENNKILEFLESGRRLHKPPYSTDEIYDLMLNCWEEEPNSRHSFSEISLFLMRVLENANSDYGYVEAIESTEIRVPEPNSDGVSAA